MSSSQIKVSTSDSDLMKAVRRHQIAQASHEPGLRGTCEFRPRSHRRPPLCQYETRPKQIAKQVRRQGIQIVPERR